MLAIELYGAEERQFRAPFEEGKAGPLAYATCKFRRRAQDS
jgi:hypothetical protein